MHIEVYADIVFLINFVMDYFIFWVVSKLIREKISHTRLITGSFTAALLYCLLIFIPQLHKFLNVFCAIIVLIISILITFMPKNFLEIMKLFILTNIVAVLIGGICMALFYFTNIQLFFNNILSVSINNFSLKTLISAFCISYVCVKLFLWQFNKIMLKRQLFYIIRISMEEQNLELNALVDTGNSLHDPISSYPVVITEFSQIKKLLPDSMCSLFNENKESDLVEVLERASNSFLVNRIRMIPFNSVGTQNGMMIGFKPDYLEVLDEKESIKSNNVIIGIYNYKLSKDGSYQALLCPDVLNIK